MQQSKNVGMVDVTRVFLAPSRTDPMVAVESAPGIGVANTISPKSLLRIRRRRVGWLLLAMLLGLAAAHAVVAASVPRYVATAPIREDGITFLRADASAVNDLRRIDGPGLPGIVRDALADYSLVVLDLGSTPRDSLPLVASAPEAGILVVAKERGSRSAVQGALALCRNARLPLAGVVLAEPVAPTGRGA